MLAISTSLSPESFAQVESVKLLPPPKSQLENELWCLIQQIFQILKGDHIMIFLDQDFSSIANYLTFIFYVHTFFTLFLGLVFPSSFGGRVVVVTEMEGGPGSVGCHFLFSFSSESDSQLQSQQCDGFVSRSIS